MTGRILDQIIREVDSYRENIVYFFRSSITVNNIRPIIKKAYFSKSKNVIISFQTLATSLKITDILDVVEWFRVKENLQIIKRVICDIIEEPYESRRVKLIMDEEYLYFDPSGM